MHVNRKILVVVIAAVAAVFTIYQIMSRPHPAQCGSAASACGSAIPQAPAGRELGRGKEEKGGPRSLLKPRLDEAGKHRLQQDPGGVLTEHATGDGGKWSKADDDLLVAWAAQDPAAALKWVDGGERAVVRAQLLGAVAAGILLHDGKDAMLRFLAEHQQDPQLRPKDQGELEKYLFYHLGREDTFDAAMEILRENNDDSLAGMMITGIDGPQNQVSAIDYMEAKGIPVTFDYWALQNDIDKDPRFWADWALQRDSNLLTEIVDGWSRDQADEAKAWVEDRVPKNDKRRADIDELLQLRADKPE